MLQKATLYFNTVKYLRPEQLFYRTYYSVRPKLSIRRASPGKVSSRRMVLEASIPSARSYENDSFTFLNRTLKCDRAIDWNFNEYGKLWTYNLNYFDFLNQERMDPGEGLWLINDYVSQYAEIRDGLEPYPSSCRMINWIKFLSRIDHRPAEIDRVLCLEMKTLEKMIEYHLMGNHLLENAFALLFSALYFRDPVVYRKSVKLLTEQLDEQVLPDGGHFELSPMYHQLVLFRLLDTVNLLKNNNSFDASPLKKLIFLAGKMLRWLVNMTFSNGMVPLFNDSAFGIAPDTAQLCLYADRLRVPYSSFDLQLKESGYRMVREGSFEMSLDVGNIGPDYIPGHAHSDTFTFEVYHNGQPLIVDTGTSTYEPGALRLHQRSTSAHNTVQIGDLEQSEMWASHRVARRAKIIELSETKGSIRASHDGYRKIGSVHSRTFETEPDRILIVDNVKGRKRIPCKSYLHFHPTVHPVVENNTIKMGVGSIHFTNAEGVTISDYDYAPQFNLSVPAKMAVIQFSDQLTTEIRL